MTSDETPSSNTPDAQRGTRDSSTEPPEPSLRIDSPDFTRELTHHPQTDTYRMEYSSAEHAPHEVVVHSVAAVEGCSPLELAPLSTVVDPDALDRLFGPTVEGSHGDGVITFDYHGYEVTLHSYGVVAVGLR